MCFRGVTANTSGRLKHARSRPCAWAYGCFLLFACFACIVREACAVPGMSDRSCPCGCACGCFFVLLVFRLRQACCECAISNCRKCEGSRSFSPGIYRRSRKTAFVGDGRCHVHDACDACPQPQLPSPMCFWMQWTYEKLLDLESVVRQLLTDVESQILETRLPVTVAVDADGEETAVPYRRP